MRIVFVDNINNIAEQISPFPDLSFADLTVNSDFLIEDTSLIDIEGDNSKEVSLRDCEVSVKLFQKRIFQVHDFPFDFCHDVLVEYNSIRNIFYIQQTSLRRLISSKRDFFKQLFDSEIQSQSAF